MPGFRKFGGESFLGKSPFRGQLQPCSTFGLLAQSPRRKLVKDIRKDKTGSRNGLRLIEPVRGLIAAPEIAMAVGNVMQVRWVFQ